MKSTEARSDLPDGHKVRARLDDVDEEERLSRRKREGETRIMTQIGGSKLGNLLWLVFPSLPGLHGVEGEGKEHPAASAGVVGVGHHPTECSC